MKILLLLPLIVIVVIFINATKGNVGKTGVPNLVSPAETPFRPFPYQIPKIPSKRSYLTYLVGDSIVASMGANAEGLRQNLLQLYPGHEFVNYNYGFPATNILSLHDRFIKESNIDGSGYPPIFEQGFDLIIIESFAYNPLSEFDLQEGLTKYEEMLDAVIKETIKTHPGSVVALMTPIAPNSKNFAKYTYSLSRETRALWVEERTAYINKLISYAEERQIPLIDVYKESLDENKDGNLKYIDPHDFIHPSKEGIKLIERKIADFIYENRIFPE